MLKWAPLILITATTLHASEPVTVAQLDQIAAQFKTQSDPEIARQLSYLELTERLPLDDFARIRASLHGDASKQALSALADNSAFFPPPSRQIATDAAPPIADQQRIASAVVDYVAKTIHKLPNFFATRITTRLEDWPVGMQQGKMITARYIPPHIVATTQAIVRYRGGIEQADPIRTKKKQQTEYGLTARGAFGPVLRTVIFDSSQSTLVWRRWEQTATARTAVFRFSVPYDKSTYNVRFCCAPIDNYVLSVLDRRTAYHGEIAVDPASGTVLRLTLQADLDKGDLGTLFSEAMEGQPLSRADLSVEYGPVEIAGKTYYCPVRAIAISRARTIVRSGDINHRFAFGPEENFINEISFSNYHLFRSESRILPATQPID
jgi:hypothetical protein